MRRRLVSARRVSASNRRKRGTMLVTIQCQRSSKRVIRGHARACAARGIPRVSDDRWNEVKYLRIVFTSSSSSARCRRRLCGMST
jgi:hypothetical protein